MTIQTVPLAAAQRIIVEFLTNTKIWNLLRFCWDSEHSPVVEHSQGPGVWP